MSAPIRIWFSDFWPFFDPNNNYLCTLNIGALFYNTNNRDDYLIPKIISISGTQIIFGIWDTNSQTWVDSSSDSGFQMTYMEYTCMIS